MAFMQVNEIAEIRIDEFFDLVEQEGGIYEVETPQGWIEIGALKKEKKECFLIRTKSEISLGAGHDHLIETQNGWEKVENLDIESTVVNTKEGKDDIVAREYLGWRDTFDFEVLSPEHKYYANGIVSHNCGKTTTCKWLRRLCIERHLDYKIVTPEKYRDARSRGYVSSLFRLASGEKGIIFFDDMEAMFQGDVDLSIFLNELDGIEPTEGVVFVFTSNHVKEQSEAFVRPNRIDLFVIFDVPTPKLRRRFVSETFHSDLLAAIGADKNKAVIENIAKKSDGYTFAELEEIRKLMAMDFIDGKEINIDAIFALFSKHREEFEARAQFGFNRMEAEDSSIPIFDDEGDWVVPPPQN